MSDSTPTTREAAIDAMWLFQGAGLNHYEVGQMLDIGLAALAVPAGKAETVPLVNGWEYTWAADLPDGTLWVSNVDRDPRHLYSWGTAFLDWTADKSAAVLPTVRRVRRRPAGPWESFAPSEPSFAAPVVGKAVQGEPECGASFAANGQSFECQDDAGHDGPHSWQPVSGAEQGEGDGRICTACCRPIARDDCPHILVTDGRVMMAEREWSRLVEELNELRNREGAVQGVIGREHLAELWSALGCARNPDDFKAEVRATMWQQAMEMVRESTAQTSRVYRENRQLEVDIAALRAQRFVPAVQGVTANRKCQTREEITALPDGSVILDVHGDVWQRRGNHWSSPSSIAVLIDGFRRQWLPAEVLHFGLPVEADQKGGER